MLEYIIQLDQKFFLFLNHINHESIDPIMLFLSKSIIPGIILLLFIFIYGYKKFNKSVLMLFFFSLVSIAISDGISSKFFKPTFKRLRPCHEPLISKSVHLASQNCRGGKFGFISSHAANTFGIATFLFLIFSAYTKKTFVVFIWAGLVSYSRIYLGKHYPLDIICGGILGLIAGYISYKLFTLIYQKLRWFYQDQ
jgi:undecaprenyl-diphosphatase